MRITTYVNAAIDDAAVVLVFVTKRYAAKVAGDNTMDNCKKVEVALSSLGRRS